MSDIHRTIKQFQRLKPFCFGYQWPLTLWFKGLVYSSFLVVTGMLANSRWLLGVGAALVLINALEMMCHYQYQQLTVRLGKPMTVLLMGAKL